MDQCIDELWKIVCEDTKELVQFQIDDKDIGKKVKWLPWGLFMTSSLLADVYELQLYHFN